MSNTGVGFIGKPHKTMSFIGTALLVFFVVTSSLISGIATYASRCLFFAEKLSNDDILLLTIIFGAFVSITFTAITPVHLSGERKRSEDWK